MNSSIPVRIHDLSKRDKEGNPKSYLARGEKDCRDNVDLSAYKAAVEHMDTITMGMVIAQPEL